MKTKTGSIGFLRNGSAIECQTKENKVKLVFNDITFDPDSMDVLIYLDHHNQDNFTGLKKTTLNQCVSLKELNVWFNETKWINVENESR